MLAQPAGRWTQRFHLFGEGNARTVKRGARFVRMEYPTRETKERCLKHYLNCKKAEYKLVSKSSKEELREHLKSSKDKFKAYYGEEISYLDVWGKVLP